MEFTQEELDSISQRLSELSEKYSKYVQRDLEDQISEEYQNKGLIYNRTSMSKTIPVIDPKEVLDLIEKGYSRLEADDDGYGSIQAKYNLSNADVKRLFSHPLLKNKKRRVPGFVFADEVAKPTEVEAPKEQDGKIDAASGTHFRMVSESVVSTEDSLFS